MNPDILLRDTILQELLVSMRAIDELFNANQVNLQLLAVTPAILSIVVLQVNVMSQHRTIHDNNISLS